MYRFPRILGIASAIPSMQYDQGTFLSSVQSHVLGEDWQQDPSLTERADEIARLFAASRVERRQSAIDLTAYYQQPRSTGERMATYRDAAYGLGSTAVSQAIEAATLPKSAKTITDFFVVSCTGYTAPGLDILIARDLGMERDIRRVVIGHMGCYGALVGLRQSLAAVRANPGATAAMLCVELSSLHFMPSDDLEVLTSYALFGDAGAAAILGYAEESRGPEVVATYCAADFAAADQMSWVITDQGFMMGLSPRVPITLRRNINGVVERLLAPHDLKLADVKHWIVHPGGPSILEVVQQKLRLSDEQMMLSWQTLREHGNCSSATVLLILEALMQSGRPQPGEWGVMMAFGPGLTLETCLLRF